MNKRIITIIISICFFAAIVFLAFNKHGKTGYCNYHSEIWADKAGYYVYLPLVFKYSLNPENFPDSIDIKTGYGFKPDYKNGKVITKYSYGVSLLQLPFYLIADNIAEPMGYQSDGFSPVYQKIINLSSVFYLFLGMFFLSRFLRYYFKKSILYTTLAIIFLGTNLFYYSIDETGMSHVYSFSLFCIFLFILKKTAFFTNNKIGFIILAGFVAGLIVLIRPTSIIFLSSFFFLDVAGRKDLLIRIKTIFNPKIFLPLLLCAVLVFIPHFIYLKYAYGSLFSYSYQNEGFFWLRPKILQLWLSPNNGLLLYTPLYIVIIGSLIYMIKKNIENGIFILALFLLISYIFSCWWDWSFGCGFGGRSFVEYIALFSIPVAHLINKLFLSRKIILIVCFSIIFLACIFYNLKMTYSYDKCFYGKGDWDWKTYKELFLSPTK
jgi:hypothetical protein